jgi:SAM-dependent methyltransferase
MTTAPEFIGTTPWWKTPAGRYLLEWEHQWFGSAVVDVFGFHALQMGMPALDALQANRMPHRWLACATEGRQGTGVPGPIAANGGLPAQTVVTAVVSATQARAVNLHCEFDALPFASQSLDLVVMPHALELARDPHLTLREVERVLVPEGRLMITAFNPASVWALRTQSRRGGGGASVGAGDGPHWPPRADMIGFRRLRDWLRLLSFEVEAARFGCFGPRVDTLMWQQRWSFLEPIGQRWWPVLGAVYGLTAVKRVRGMRLVGLAKRQARYANAPRPALVNTQRGTSRPGAPRS